MHFTASTSGLRMQIVIINSRRIFTIAFFQFLVVTIWHAHSTLQCSGRVPSSAENYQDGEIAELSLQCYTVYRKSAFSANSWIIYLLAHASLSNLGLTHAWHTAAQAAAGLWQIYYSVSQKNDAGATLTMVITFCQFLIDLQNSFTAAMQRALNFQRNSY